MLLLMISTRTKGWQRLEKASLFETLLKQIAQEAVCPSSHLMLYGLKKKKIFRASRYKQVNTS